MEGSFGAGGLKSSVGFPVRSALRIKRHLRLADVNKGGTAMIRPLQETAEGVVL